MRGLVTLVKHKHKFIHVIESDEDVYGKHLVLVHRCKCGLETTEQLNDINV